MVFAQLTYRESLRDIETCLRSLGPKLYHTGDLPMRSDVCFVKEFRPDLHLSSEMDCSHLALFIGWALACSIKQIDGAGMEAPQHVAAVCVT